MKTKINCNDPRTGKPRLACLDTDTDRAHFSDGQEYSLSYLKKNTPGGVGFFETFLNGKIFRKKGMVKKS